MTAACNSISAWTIGWKRKREQNKAKKGKEKKIHHMIDKKGKKFSRCVAAILSEAEWKVVQSFNRSTRSKYEGAQFLENAL